MRVMNRCRMHGGLSLLLHERTEESLRLLTEAGQRGGLERWRRTRARAAPAQDGPSHPEGTAC